MPPYDLRWLREDLSYIAQHTDISATLSTVFCLCVNVNFSVVKWHSRR